MHKILLIWSVVAVLVTVTTGCEKTDEPLENENSENTENTTQPDNPGDITGSSDPIIINPTIEGEAKLFIGEWIGNGPYKNSNKTIESYWQFHNDGTFTWCCDKSGGRSLSYGTWQYLPDKKMLITSSGENSIYESWNWSIENISQDEWVGTCINSVDKTFTYRRVENPITPSEVRIMDYTNDGFIVTDTIKNYLYNSQPLKVGVCYGNSSLSDPNAFQKVYASEIKLIGTMNHYGVYAHNWTYNPNGLVTVQISGLVPGEKYKLCSFLEFEDGRVVYGDIYKAICIKKPEIVNTVHIPQSKPDKDGYIYLWATCDVDTLGILHDPLTEHYSGNYRWTHVLERYEDAISSLGENWVFPPSTLFKDLNDNGEFNVIRKDRTYVGVWESEFDENYKLYFNLTSLSDISTLWRPGVGSSYLRNGLGMLFITQKPNIKPITYETILLSTDENKDALSFRNAYSLLILPDYQFLYIINGTDYSIYQILCRPVYKVKATW